MMRKLYLIILLYSLLPLSSIEAADYYIRYYTEREGYFQSHVTSVLQDTKGMIWIGTWDGLYCYDGYKFHRFKSEIIDGKSATEYRIKRIMELPNHDILCLWPGHAFRFNHCNNSFHEYPNCKESANEHFIPSDELKAKVAGLPEFRNRKFSILCVDKQQGIWIFSDLGFCRLSFNLRGMTPIKLTDAPEEIIGSLQTDRKGRIWVANKNDVVTLSNPERTQMRFLTPDGRLTDKYTVFGHNIYCFYEDIFGNVWLGSRMDGVFRLTPKDDDNWQILHLSMANSNLNCDMIYDIAEDHFGHIWLATHGGGLNVITNPQSDCSQIVNAGNGLDYNGGKDAEMDARRLLIHKDRLMVGTNGGLLTATIVNEVTDMYFNQYIHDPGNATSIGDNKVRTIVLPKGTNDLYIGTYGGGLSRATLEGKSALVNNKMGYNTSNSNIPGEIVMGLSADDKGRIWGTTVSFLFSLNQRRDSLSVYPINYTGDNYQFTETDPIMMPDGEMLLGTTQGLLMFSPEKMMDSLYVPPIYTNMPDTIDLTLQNNDIFIRMSALDYNGQDRIVFAYRIDGIDSDWIYTLDHNIYYPSLPPGEWKLRIKSTNSDGLWVNNEHIIYINRHAAFNERPIAWMLYGVLAFFGIVALVLVIRYIHRLHKEMNNIKLTYQEKLEYTSARLHDSMQTLEHHLLQKNEEPELLKEDMEYDAKYDEQQRNAEFIEDVKQYVNEHFTDSNLSIDEIAAHMTLSRCVFYMKMKQLFGVTPNNYLLQRRIDYAKQLLKRQNFNVSETAYHSGFSDPHYFSRVFRKVTGISPSTYQEQFKSPEQ